MMERSSELNRWAYAIAVVIMIISTIIGIYYINEKSGYYVDEGMTLVLSNGEFNGAVTTRPEYNFIDFVKTFILRDSVGGTVANVKQMLTDVATAGNYSVEGTVEWYDAARGMLQGESTWVTGEELYNQLVAEKGNRFNYSQVYVNQAVDVHPPLYYTIVHTIFSFAAGRYSKLFLFAINICFLLLATLYGFKMLLAQYGAGNPIPYLFVALYGLSQGYFSNAMYFRMYAMLSFWVVMIVYWHVMTDADYTRKDLIKLSLLVLAGFGTQYYFILFLFPLFVINSILLIKDKKKSVFIKYLKTMIISGIISLICWPFSLYHILFGYRGTEAMKSISSGGFGKKMLVCLKIIKKAVFLNSWFVVLACFAIVLAAAVLILRGKCTIQKGRIYLAILLSAIFYFVIVAKIAPANSMRYFMCIQPVVIMIILVMTEGLVRVVVKDINKRLVYAISFAVAAVYMIITLFTLKPDYLYLEERDLKLGIDENTNVADLNCLMIAMQHGEGFPLALKLSEFKEVMVIDQDKLAVLNEDHPTDNSSYVVYIDVNCKVDEDLELFREYMNIDADSITMIDSDINGFVAYYVES